MRAQDALQALLRAQAEFAAVIPYLVEQTAGDARPRRGRPPLTDAQKAERALKEKQRREKMKKETRKG